MTQSAFADLPADAYPFDVVARDADSGQVLWTRTVAGPGALHVPGKPDGVRQVTVTVTFANGTVETL